MQVACFRQLRVRVHERNGSPVHRSAPITATALSPITTVSQWTSWSGPFKPRSQARTADALLCGRQGEGTAQATSDDGPLV